ncbi:UTRA domain-containing protein [Stakelama marina]|uniref:UTRA domain-containing protein n=1 Tax=Stakelama marina TaxID=2826939 RepID=A0A8T4IBP2_9SPHN|nr:UTRA domain-containing protein [Stakelama marina]MBR0552438.1 UTRA domain-containing protein [Stakelama marina]
MTLAERIRSDIESRIRAGELRPGDRIPFEHELVADYGCARATVNKALSQLAREGLIERRKRAGSFVAHPHFESAALEIPDIGALLASRGEAYRFELTGRTIEASAGNAVDPPFAARGRMLALTGTHHAGDTPFAGEFRLIDLAAVAEAEAVDFDALAPGTWLLDHVPWTQGRHRISAIAADAELAHRLAIRVGSACLQLERWTWRMEAAITYARQCFPGDRYDLVAEFSPAA